jgi:hypothetical protein
MKAPAPWGWGLNLRGSLYKLDRTTAAGLVPELRVGEGSAQALLGPRPSQKSQESPSRRQPQVFGSYWSQIVCR